jgi:hypothetical protein
MAREEDFAPKYWKFQQVLKAMILDRHLRAGDRLPSVRQLCRDSGLSLGTIQKASRRLVEERVLVRKRGSGTYVRELPVRAWSKTSSDSVTPGGGAPGPRAGGRAPGLPVSVVRTIRFCAESSSPEHTSLWRNIIRDFERCQHHTRVDIADVSPTETTPETLSAMDLIETGGFGSEVPFRIRAADLSGFGFVAPETDTPGLTGFVPLHLSVPCLAYNKELLDRLGVPPPQFLGFDDQMAFLENVKDRLRTHRGVSFACNVPPHLYLGELEDELVRRMQNRETLDLDPKQRALIDKTIRLKELLFHGRRPDDYNDGNWFSEGRAPVFPCWHYQVMAFRKNKLPFELGVHPFFSADGTIRSHTMGVCVNADSRYPVECVRFIRHLLSDGGERRLVEGGDVPARIRDLSGVFAQASSCSQDALASLADRVFPCLPPDREKQYIVLSILDPELYAAVSADDFLGNIQVMGDGFMRLARKRNSRNIKEEER